MVGKEADDKIQKITKLLEKGGTMLATHHECGAPMFRFQGKVVCPVCDFEEKKQITEQTMEKQQIEQGKEKEPLKTPVISLQSGDLKVINDRMVNKIRDLVISLENETDLCRVRDKMECIEEGLKILKLLRE